MEISKKRIIFIDLDGTLIDTVSGKTFPEGVWDMKLKMEVFEQLKKLHPQAVLIASNQGGIELGYVHPAMFQPKFIYVIASLQSFIGINTFVAGQYCASNDPSCPDRKPNPGMLEKMYQEFCSQNGFTITKEECLMIGDSYTTSEGRFIDNDSKVAEAFGCDYLDVKDFIALELPEPLYKVFDMKTGTIPLDGNENPLTGLKEEEAIGYVTSLSSKNPNRYTYVPMLWEPPVPKQATQKKQAKMTISKGGKENGCN